MFNYDESYKYVSITMLKNGEKLYFLHNDDVLEEEFLHSAKPPYDICTLSRKTYAKFALKQVQKGKTIALGKSIYKIGTPEEIAEAKRQKAELDAELDAMPMPDWFELSNLTKTYKENH